MGYAQQSETRSRDVRLGADGVFFFCFFYATNAERKREREREREREGGWFVESVCITVQCMINHVEPTRRGFLMDGITPAVGGRDLYLSGLILLSLPSCLFLFPLLLLFLLLLLLLLLLLFLLFGLCVDGRRRLP